MWVEWTVGAAADRREIFPHRHYRLVYEVAGELVTILALVHTSRQWPRQAPSITIFR